MLDCAPLLEITVACTFGMSTLFLCMYAHRMYSNFRPHGKRYVALSTCNMVTTTTVLGIYISSNCHALFLNWGGVVFALSFMLLIVEVFVYCTYSEREEVIVEFPTTTTEKRLGTVITTGKLAATISEHETQRQFIAKFTIWGDLEPGNLVSFCIDPSFLHLENTLSEDAIISGTSVSRRSKVKRRCLNTAVICIRNSTYTSPRDPHPTFRRTPDDESLCGLL